VHPHAVDFKETAGRRVTPLGPACAGMVEGRKGRAGAGGEERGVAAGAPARR
jgi:hypothetical protein